MGVDPERGMAVKLRRAALKYWGAPAVVAVVHAVLVATAALHGPIN